MAVGSGAAVQSLGTNAERPGASVRRKGSADRCIGSVSIFRICAALKSTHGARSEAVVVKRGDVGAGVKMMR